MKKVLILGTLIPVCGSFSSLAQAPLSLLVNFNNGYQVRLSWTNAPGTIILEETDRLAAASVWKPSPTTPILVNGWYSVLLDIPGPGRFFRLHKIDTGDSPPDPATVASAIPLSAATLLGEATAFLYSGINPIQTGVASNTIKPERAAVLRGKVKQRDNTPLSGVAISILKHPQLGQTLSRADGVFDLAVNGGGLLTVKYEKANFCSVQRQLSVPLQDYVISPDVVMVPLDPIVTSVALGTNSPMQVHQGSLQTDADGARKSTLLFTPGTTAGLVLPNGTTQPVSSLSVRTTEFTVGTNGPVAMPGVLPSNSGYTYCVELSADEAMAQSASRVQFDRPVFTYVENFIGFPVGMAVPVGFYDRNSAAWVPSPNGRVIKILSINGGFAEVDTDGDGHADTGEGITSEERQQLAKLYTGGQTLWRVPVTHFTPWDCNWPFGPPTDATAPDTPPPTSVETIEQGICQENGSVIEAQNQILGETIEVVGTPYTLNYRSDRVAGRTLANTIEIQLSGATVPASLKRIELVIQVGGRTSSQNFPAQPEQKTTFTWDGQDAYGRTLQGSQPITGTIGYVYDGVYQQPSPFRLAFGLFGGAVITGNSTRQEIILSMPFARTIGTWDARGQSLGGWTLNRHHAYDQASRVLYLGDGNRQRALNHAQSISTVAGTGLPGFNGDGDLATRAQLSTPRGVALGPDGSLYIADAGNSRIRRVSPDGIITTVVGTGTQGFSGDGGPAIQAQLNNPIGIAVGPEGSLYIANGDVEGADNGNSRIRRVGPDGIITTVAGTGTLGFSGDGGPAAQAQLNSPFGVALGPDGSLYIADAGNRRIRRVAPDGIITTVVGAGTQGSSGDGGPAIQAELNRPIGVALGPDGSLYISDFLNQSVRRVAPNGIITTVAGTGVQGFSGDGGPATQAQLNSAIGVALGPNGSLYIADSGNSRIRRVAPDGIITTVAGTGTQGSSGDGGPATQARLLPAGVALGSDGSLYVSDFLSQRVRRVAGPLPGFRDTDLVVPSEEGGLLYRFDASGRHLQTLNALTGSVIFQFGYDANGRLSQVIEKTGGTDNVTTLQHDGNGNPTRIVSPFGQKTELAVDANGFVSRIINPAGETNQMTYTAGGLLTSFTDGKAQTSTYAYDNLGRLASAADSCCGIQTYTSTNSYSSNVVTRTTGLGRVTTYAVQTLSNGDQRLVNTSPDGTESTLDLRQDATQIRSTPDGTVSSALLGPDPRFGMQSPMLANWSVQFRSGLQSAVTHTRSAVLANPDDPLSLVSLTETTTVNGRTSTNTYTAATRTFVNSTPEGRIQSFTLDELGRLVTSRHGNLASLNLVYDTRGRVASVRTGTGEDTRTTSFIYNPQGSLASASDQASRTAHFTHDAAERTTQQTLADGSAISFEYDAVGNLTSIFPPERPAYRFAYSSNNQLTNVTPPVLSETGPTTYVYNDDRQITAIVDPDGRVIGLDYDRRGRPSSRTITSGGVTNAIYTASYDASSGQLQTITGPGSQGLTYTYDGGHIVSAAWTGTVSGTVTQTHDTALRIAVESLNGINPVTFRYDADNLLAQAGDLSIERDPINGLPTAERLGVVNQNISFSSLAQITQHAATASGALLYHATYTRDSIGRVAQVTEALQGVTNRLVYSYDVLSRLTNVTRNGKLAESYVYDSNGNRIRAVVAGIGSDAILDVQDRLIQQGAVQYTYNGSGQLTTRTEGAQITTYAYDPMGNLLRVTLPDGTDLTYQLDGMNRRIGRRINGVLGERFLYSGHRAVAQLDANGAVLSRFIYARSRVPAYLTQGSVAFRILTDRQGSVRLVVNTSTGAVVQRLDYDSFGNVTLDTNPGFQPFGFAGGFYDPATKLVRFGVRDYHPETGRWTAKDPFWFAGADGNLYRYCRNDPVNLVDPVGAIPTDQELITYLREVIATTTRTINANAEQLLAQGFTPANIEQAEAAQQALFDDILAKRESRRFAQQELKRLRELSSRKSLMPVQIGKINCGGLASRALSPLALLDFVTVYQRSLESGRSFFEELDIQGAHEKDQQFKAGVHTTVNFIGPFVLVSETL